MNKNKTTANHKKEIFTREELLGVEKAFTLGDSEVVAKRVMDFILKIVMNRIRIKYVESLMNDYIVNKTFSIITNITDVKLTSDYPDRELEVSSIDYKYDYEGKFDVARPKIDSWASNKAKLQVVKPGEIPALNEVTTSLPSTNNSRQSNLSFRNTIKLFKPLVSQLPSNNTTSTKKLGDVTVKKDVLKEAQTNLASSFEKNNSSNISTSNIISKTSLLVSPTQSVINYKRQESSVINNSVVESVKKQFIKVVNQTPKKKELEIEQYPIVYEEDDREPIDEVELVKLKTLRIYFKEKEIEKERKKKLEKEIEERTREEEKKKKKLLEESHGLFSFDYDGRLIAIKPPEIDKLYYPPSASINIKNKENYHREDNTKKPTKKEETQPIIKTEDDLPQTYYQPDPLVSHVIPPGVTMESYGVKKEGGKFPEVPGKLSHREFITLLNMYRPSHTGIIFNKTQKQEENNNKDNNVINNNYNPVSNALNNQVTNVISENDELDLKESIRLTNIFNFNDEGNLDFKKGKRTSDFIKNPNKNKQALNEIKKKQKLEKINAIGEFDLNNINLIDDERIYDIFNVYNQKSELIMNKNNTNNKLPKNVHVDIGKEMGKMKKYPRERISKEVLAKSSKLHISQETERQFRSTNKKPMFSVSKSQNF